MVKRNEKKIDIGTFSCGNTWGSVKISRTFDITNFPTIILTDNNKYYLFPIEPFTINDFDQNKVNYKYIDKIEKFINGGYRDTKPTDFRLPYLHAGDNKEL